MYDFSIHMTTLTLISVLALITGVYTQVAMETEVNIIIRVPPGLLKPKSEVYFSEHRNSTMIVGPMRNPIDVYWFGKYSKFSVICNTFH